MPTHSVHSRTLRKRLYQSRRLKVVWIARYFFAPCPTKGKRLWVKFRFLPSSRWTGVILQNYIYGKAYEDLRLDRCDIDKIRENALYHVTPDYSISMLDEWRKDNTNICYLAEATPDNSDYISGLLRMWVVDEIILYTVPFISGTGRHFFKSALPEARWTLSSQKSYSNGVYRSIYTRMETMK